MRVLIIEDRQGLADEYLRIFNHLLVGEYSYTHVLSIEAAIPPLAQENWDVILVDQELGAPGVFPMGEEEDSLKLSNGYDLVTFRRNIEDGVEDIAKSHIIGIASNKVALTFFNDLGANETLLKIFMPEMAESIRFQAEKKA
jgi:hypothetical protein